MTSEQPLSAAPPPGTSVASLLRQYDRPGPRYTSYPTAVEFNGTFDDAASGGRLDAAASMDEPLSLYAHLPFCDRVLSSGCNVIVSRTARSR